MTEYSPLFTPHVDEYSEYTSTTTQDTTQTTIQFTLPWSVDRPYEGIKSVIVVDHRGRVIDLSLRPGPLEQYNWSDRDALHLLRSAIVQSNPPFSDPQLTLGNQYETLWRTHLDVTDPAVHVSDIANWLPQFLDAYDTQYHRYLTTPPSRLSRASCFDCATNPATCIVEVCVTENVDSDIGLCADCATEFVHHPFAKPYTSRAQPVLRNPLTS